MFLTKVGGLIMGPVSRVMGWIFSLIYNLFYGLNFYSIGLSIILFTVVVRLIIFPFGIKMTRNNKIQQYLQPEFNKINKKYKGKKDQDSMLKQQKELSALRAKYGIKTTSGCLTSIIQLPILYGLYNVINNVPAYVSKVRNIYLPIAEAIVKTENGYDKLSQFIGDNAASFKRVTTTVGQFDTNLETASEAGKTVINTIIDVLSKCGDNLLQQLSDIFSSNPDVAQSIASKKDEILALNDFIGINMSEAPGFHWSRALIIPIFAFAAQMLSMFLMPKQKTGDAQQDQMAESMRRTMMILPVTSLIFAMMTPAGLGLYWGVSALVGALITVLTNKYYDSRDMKIIVDKQLARVEAERAKKGNKKSFSEKIMEAAYGQSEANEAAQKQASMRNYSSAKLKNYSSPSAYINDEQSSDQTDLTDTGKTYKPGSLGARANAVRDFNNKGEQ